LPVAAMFLTVGADCTTLNSWNKNREALKKYELKSYYPAFKELLLALQDDPKNPALHMNLGRVFEANEEYEKAEQAYRGALQVIPEGSPLKFEALFNLGNAQVGRKQIEAALESYQAALEINPDSIEVKNNIEILTQGGGQGGEGDGEGEDESKDQKEKKDQKPQDDKKDQKDKKPKKPKPFDSKDLTPQDVKKILDEIKNQEQAIRAQEYDKGAKEGPKGKDW
jgi:tetratricopeptide (TPR) repeat protein